MRLVWDPTIRIFQTQ